MGSVPKVSVVLPTYNQAEFLPKALDSIFNQSWQDFELIVVNDGSTDETPTILANYRQRYDFTLIHQENQKLPKTLNNGFKQAKGTYLTWTSSDNLMRPNMLAVLVDALDKNPQVGLVYADWEVIDENDKFLGTVQTFDFDRYLLMRTNYINACFMYRRTCQETVGLYDPEYIYAEDWEYWLRIASTFDMMRVPQPLYQYRVHGASLTEKEVLSQDKGVSVGYHKLSTRLKASRWAWYLSKLKWEWLRLKLRRDPSLRLKPSATG